MMKNFFKSGNGDEGQQPLKRPRIVSKISLDPADCGSLQPVKLEEPTSSLATMSGTMTYETEMARLRARLKESEAKRQDLESKHCSLLKDLREAVECPVCFIVPRSSNIPCCRNGHFLCKKCKLKCVNGLCPTCRTAKIDCISQVANLIIQKIEHFCEFRDDGCEVKGDIVDIQKHEGNCEFRTVRCPHWACNMTMSARKLSHHVIAEECGDSYREKALPYREEMVYTQKLDDEYGNGFWKPSLLQYDGITFYLQVEKCGKSKNWYFYIQMEGSPKDCEKYATMIRVSKNKESERNSIIYNGVVCPVDVKGAKEVEACGAGLNIRDAAMEKIFDVDLDKDEENGEGFKFYVDVDIYKVDDS